MALRRAKDDGLAVFGTHLEGMVATLPQKVVVNLEVVEKVAVGPETPGADLVVAGGREAGEAVVQTVIKCVAGSAFDPEFLVEVLGLEKIEYGGVVGVAKAEFIVQGGVDGMCPTSHPVVAGQLHGL